MKRIFVFFIIALLGLALFVISAIKLYDTYSSSSGNNLNKEQTIKLNSTNGGENQSNIINKEPPKIEDNSIYSSVDQMPQFVGGEVSFEEYIRNNLSYPYSAKVNKISGVVYTQFVINKDGSISDIKVIQDIGDGCGDEAFRLLNNMPSWTPGYKNGEAKNVQISLPITFNLPEPTYETCSHCDGKGSTYKDITCSICNGYGTANCYYCSGKGAKNCSYCSGKGKSKCDNCSGKGFSNCNYCDGKGYNQCKSCNGYGYLKCGKCNGKGKLIDRYNRLHTCRNCGGYGKFQCKTCLGYKNIQCGKCRGQRTFVCKFCNGQSNKTCKYCRGKGNLLCNNCNGSGQNKCSSCNGSGRVRTKVECQYCSGNGQIEKY